MNEQDETLIDDAEEAARIHAADSVDLGRGGFQELPDKYNKMAIKEAPKSLAETLGLGGYKADSFGLSQEPQVEAPIAGPAPDGQMVPPNMPEQTPILQQQTMPGASVPQPAVQAQDPSMPGMLGGNVAQNYATVFGQKETAIRQMADAEAQRARQMAEIAKQEQQQLAVAQENYMKTNATLQAEHKQLFDAAMNNKIDGNRLYANMSTGNKILAIISIMMGGIGAGLSGKPGENVALDVLNKAVDRDIEAQRLQLGKTNTLLSENLRRTGDLNTAMQMTRLQINSVNQAKIAQVAASFGTKEAEAKKNMLLASLNAEAIQTGDLIAKKQAEKAMFNAMTNGGNLTDAQVNAIQDEKLRERFVKVGGKYQVAASNEDAKKAKEVIGNTDALIGGIDRILADRKKYGSSTIPGEVKTRMKKEWKSVQLGLKKAETLGTLDKGSVEFLDEFAPDPTGFGFMEDAYKALKETQLSKSSAQLNALGIKYGQGPSQQPQYVERQAKDGTIWLFDPNTKQPVRPK